MSVSKRTLLVKKKGSGDGRWVRRAPSREHTTNTFPTRTELTEQMFAQVLLLADRLTRNQLRFGVGVGARSDEIEDLKWSDVDLTHGRVRFAQPMTLAGGRFAPLPPDVKSMLLDMKTSSADPKDSVWGDARGTSRIPLRTRWRRLFVLWAKAHAAGQAASPPPLIAPPLHALRRFAIRQLLDRGVPADEVAVCLGVRIDSVKRQEAAIANLGEVLP